jgi:DNA-binding transcriptional MerR regulator
MSIWDDDQPMFNIGVVAQLLQVHPETLRIWEKNDLIKPTRKNKQRLYSNNDLRRLKFIHQLINDKGLNIAGVQQVISMYSCWQLKSCPGSQLKNNPENVNQHKPCWLETGSHCLVIHDRADLCNSCEFYQVSCQRQ